MRAVCPPFTCTALLETLSGFLEQSTSSGNFEQYIGRWTTLNHDCANFEGGTGRESLASTLYVNDSELTR